MCLHTHKCKSGRIGNLPLTWYGLWCWYEGFPFRPCWLADHHWTTGTTWFNTNFLCHCQNHIFYFIFQWSNTVATGTALIRLCAREKAKLDFEWLQPKITADWLTLNALAWIKPEWLLVLAYSCTVVTFDLRCRVLFALNIYAPVNIRMYITQL